MKKLLPFALIIILIVIWFGKIPQSAVVVEEGGSPVVYFYGGTAREMIQVTFNPDTEIAVARGLGTWKASSIYGLARDEGVGETLVAESIRHNLMLPVKATRQATIGKAGLILAKFKYAKRTKVINLKSVTGETANSLYLEIKSSFFPKTNASASIIFKAYDPKVLEKSKKLIEALGFNVFYIKKDNLDRDLVCRITGPKHLMSAWVRSTFFSCEKIYEDTDGLTFEFGEKYAKNY